MDTIVALSSGRSPAAIGIVRVSGPDAIAAAAALAGTLPLSRRAGLRALRDGGGALLDRALVLVFPGPDSATGEDLVELHCHGGRAVIEAVLAAITGQPGCRAAEPGEFTRRALLHGRLDFAEAEGLADLLEAETEMQRVAALAAVEGRVSRQVTSWMATISALSAQVEAAIDYDDEDDVIGDDVVWAQLRIEAKTLGVEIAAAVSAPPVERLRDGIRVAIAGPPNAGKSTLLNLLAEREAAIVSPIAGTTRDVIEVPVRRAGIPFVLTDTAGLTDTDDAIEAIGVERARGRIEAADLVLWLGDEERVGDRVIGVHARADQVGRELAPAHKAFSISRDDEGSIERLWDGLVERAASLLPRGDAVPWRERHRRLCASAAATLAVMPNDPLLIAEQLRRARGDLAQIVGVDATEAMLDAMFSRFCLGK